MTLDQVLALILQHSFCFCLRQWCLGMDIDGSWMFSETAGILWQSTLMAWFEALFALRYSTLIVLWHIIRVSCRQCHEGSTLILSVRIKGHEASIMKDPPRVVWGCWILDQHLVLYHSKEDPTFLCCNIVGQHCPNDSPHFPSCKRTSVKCSLMRNLLAEIVFHVTLRLSM